MSPAKLKGKKSRIPQTPVTASSTVPPRPSSQLVLPITTQETAPRNIRLTSIPPIECIIEPTNPDLGRMEIPIMSPPVSQANGDDSRRVSLTKSATSVNVSAEAQSANLRFVQNAVPRTTEHISSGQTAQRPLRVSTDTVVPKVEIQSPMITQPLHPLPQKPPSSNSGIPDAPHLKTVRRPTPTGDMQTPHNERSRRSDENVDCAGVLDTNRGSNISSDTNTKKSVPSTSPLISPPVPYRNLFPQDEQSIDPARSSQQVNHETQRTFHQNDLPHAFLHGSGPSNTYPSYHRENVSISPPRSIGVKRPRDSARLDDMDGRHWSSGQEVVGRRDRLSRRRYDCRTPSGSPPLRFRDESRPLVERLEQIRESGVYRPSSGGETYIPNYASHSPADTADRERRRDDVEGYPVPSDSRPELLDRFSNMTNPQHPKRQNGPPLRGTARRGRRGAPLSLEQRIS
ncbi:hypothetical protein AX14_009608 [Amanita brunnescens Koide BX004]|nr:hypothetical protein AX14_009608 [Amanita brunnescens Koide BX004]